MNETYKHASANEAGFDYTTIPLGFYDEVMRTGHPIRRCWHRQKFARVAAALPESGSILDLGCFCGTFLSLLDESRYSRQLGVDILPPQIEWAREHYGTERRDFRYIESFKDLSQIDEMFDGITLIEVMEHLAPNDIRSMFEQVERLLRPGGSFVLTTPNFASTWPVLEVILDRLSEVKYGEQHVSKFTYWNFERKLAELVPGIWDRFRLEIKTTSHFVSPFIGVVSERLAMWISRFRKPIDWRIPLGNLILARLVQS